MSGDLNDYHFAFIALEVNTIKIIMMAMFCLYMYFSLKQATLLTVKWERFINEIVIFCALSRLMRVKLFLHLE